MFRYDLESDLMGLLHGVHRDIQIMWFVFLYLQNPAGAGEKM